MRVLLAVEHESGSCNLFGTLKFTVSLKGVSKAATRRRIVGGEEVGRSETTPTLARGCGHDVNN